MKYVGQDNKEQAQVEVDSGVKEDVQVAEMGDKMIKRHKSPWHLLTLQHLMRKRLADLQPRVL